MKKLRIFMGIIAFSMVAYSTPTWMWVGTYAIDNYTGNGGGAGNLNWSIADALCFAFAADMYCDLTRYYVNLTDADVTHVSFSNNGTRELCDFVYYQGHGSYGEVFLGGGTNYGSITPSDMVHGTSYNRWVEYSSCLTLIYRDDLFSYWSPAFSGVQTILGYASITYGLNDEKASLLHDEFWERWAWWGDGMWTAHAQSVFHVLYAQGGLDVAPAVISGYYLDGDNYVPLSSRNYTETTSDAGTSPYCWAQCICGDPNY